MADTDSNSYQQIWQTASTVPYGFVATYGQIATLAGYPRAARLVGQALKHLPKNSQVPWHRIVNAQGRISFPKSSSQFALQKKKLSSEGIVFSKDRIDLKRFGWQNSLDELLWKPVD